LKEKEGRRVRDVLLIGLQGSEEEFYLSNLERSSSRSIDWSSEACGSHKLQLKIPTRKYFHQTTPENIISQAR